MTTPLVIPGEGTIVSMKISAAFVEIGLVVEATGPDVKVAPVDTTHLTSTLHTRRPSRLPDPDKVSLTIFFDPNDTSMHQLIADRVNSPGTIDDFKITFADAHVTHGTATFSGFFTSFELNGMKVEENIGADIEIQPTTIVTYTEGADS